MTFSNVVACMALFVALGGTSYAALTITGKNVKDSSLTGKDVKRSSLTGSDVRNRSLTGSDIRDGSLGAGDFAAGQLPSGQTGPAGPAGPAGPKGDVGPAGVIDASFAFQDYDGLILPEEPPPSSQLNFLTPDDPGMSGGLLEVTRPGQLHAEATVVLNRAPGAGGAAFCVLRLSGGDMSNEMIATFFDAGQDKNGEPMAPSVTLPLVGTARVQPGTHNVGIRCDADRPNLVRMSRAELHAVVYDVG